MDRRDYLATLSVAGLSGLAGCGALFDRDGIGDPPDGCGVPDTFAANRGSLPPDDTPTDGIPPAMSETPPSRDVDYERFRVVTVEGVDVRLVPVDVVHYWWLRGAARFADARDRDTYDRAHVYGAVWSPAGSDPTCDPVTYWPDSDRIVCYGGSAGRSGRHRAAALINDDFDNVYAIRGGFPAWHRGDYPVAGVAVDPSASSNATG